MPQPASSGARTDAAQAGTAAAAAAGATSATAQAGGAAAQASSLAMLGAGAIVAALLAFLVSMRETRRQWLAKQLGRYASSPDDIAEVIAREMQLEEIFAQRSADRLAAGLPQALGIEDPQARATAVRALLEKEERYARQRNEAMTARAINAAKRAELRRTSPAGAWWRLGFAVNHTPGCIVMAGGSAEGSGKFWPWAVLDRVHPPRHYGCTSTLHSFGEAISQGWMSAGDVPKTRDAIRAASGVLMEGEGEALERELDVRERLVEMGADADALALRPWEGLGESIEGEEVCDGTAAAV